MHRILSYILGLGQLLTVIGISMLFANCNKEDSISAESTLQDWQAYYPVSVGYTWTYQVDSIIFDPVGNGVLIDSSSSNLQNEVVDSFFDAQNHLVYAIEQRIWDTIGQEWLYQHTWFAEALPDRIETEVDNLRFQHLVFPATTGLEWEGSKYIDPQTTVEIAGETILFFKSWNSVYQEVDLPYSVGSIQSDSSLLVNHANAENAIEYRFVTERYGRGIGLMQREVQIMDTQQIDSALPWPEKAEKGLIVRQTLTAFSF